MKVKYSILLFVFLFLYSFSKEVIVEDDEGFYMTFLRDGNFWDSEKFSSTYDTTHNVFLILAFRYNSFESDEKFWIEFEETALTPEYKDTLFISELLDVVGGDAVISWYEISKDRSSDYLNITDIDTMNQIIKGEFSMVLSKANDKEEKVYIQKEN